MAASLREGKKGIWDIQGLTGSAKALALVGAVSRGIHIVVLSNREEAIFFAHDLETNTDPERVFFYPASAKKKLDRYSDSSAQVQRTAALHAIMASQEQALPTLIATYPQALMQRVAGQKALGNNSFRIAVGDKLSHEFLKEQLLFMGFERVEFVCEPGQFAIRGGIIDLFSYAENRAYRIDFFGDEVEEIRVFDCNTQRSIEKRKEVMLIPNMQDVEEGAQGVSLLEFVGERSVLWIDTSHLQELLITEGQERLLQNFGRYYFSPLPGGDTPTGAVTFHTQPQPSFNKNFEILEQELLKRSENGYKICLLSESHSQMERFRQIFISSELQVEYQIGSLHEGFIDHTIKWCVYTDHQIFDRFYRVRASRAVERSERITVQELSGFQIGDYIVHIDHGVGIFGGLVRTEINGKMQEVIKLIYKNNDVLFVNIHGLHRISKYKSKDAQPPKVYQLGSGAWQKLKQQVKSKVKDIAQELIRLYAKRQSSQGFAFAADCYLQHELESSFIYQDTPDQLKATQAVKADMERSCPMDR
ncbi:MAG: transcription-repair coupling factor, partial [Bacteroidales bacterium]|nr:transcription-repair coupling factor [Bacteroidales bacterium]